MKKWVVACVLAWGAVLPAAAGPVLVSVVGPDKDPLSPLLKNKLLAHRDSVMVVAPGNNGVEGVLEITQADGVHAQFIANGSKLVIFEESLSLSDHLAMESTRLAHRILDAAPKLRLDAAKAIPVAVVKSEAHGDGVPAGFADKLLVLLEGRLDAVPEYVVVERQYGLPVSSSLPDSLPAHVAKANLIRVAISGGSTGDCTADVELTTASGKLVKMAVMGKADAPGNLANKIVTEVRKAIGGSEPAAAANPNPQAAQYVQDGIVCRVGDSMPEALLALDAAELYGAALPDVEAQRVPVLGALVDDTLQEWTFPFRADDMSASKLGPDELKRRAVLAQRGLAEARRFEAEKMETHMDVSLLPSRPDQVDGYWWGLTRKIAYPAGKILMLLDRTNQPADELRQTIRTTLDYDPLHGKAGRVLSDNPGAMVTRDDFADDIATSAEEELAFYRLICNDKQVVLPMRALGLPEANFCARLIPREERLKAYKELVESLKDKPESARTYFVLKTRDPDAAVADEAYRKVLGKLWDVRDELVTSEKYTAAPEVYHDIPQPLTARNADAGLPLLHYLLKSEKPSGPSMLMLKMLFHGESVSATDAPVLWAEVNHYRAALQAAYRAKNGNLPNEGLDYEIDQVVTPMMKKYPAVCVKPQAPEPDEKQALVVKRFWTPGQAIDDLKSVSYIGDSGVCADGLWVKSYIENPGPNGPSQILFHIELPSLATDAIPVPMRSTSEMRVVPDAVYVHGWGDGPQRENLLARYDVNKATWETRKLPVFQDGRMQSATSSIYFVLNDRKAQTATLAQYDWATSAWTELTNNQKDPVLTQFPGIPPVFVFGGIYDGPGRKPIVSVLGRGLYVLGDGNEPWQEVFDSGGHQTAHVVGDKTLFSTQTGEAVLVDANASAPEYWVANSTPHYRKQARPGSKANKETTPWADKANWVIPSEERPLWYHGAGFHDETLYALDQPDKSDPYAIICMTKGDPKPHRIPLLFKLDPVVRAQIPVRPGAEADTTMATPELVEHPQRAKLGGTFQMVATNQGICLTFRTSGFWFIPFSDIDDFVKKHPTASAAQTKSAAPASL